jgi:hypothetical protein
MVCRGLGSRGPGAHSSNIWAWQALQNVWWAVLNGVAPLAVLIIRHHFPPNFPSACSVSRPLTARTSRVLAWIIRSQNFHFGLKYKKLSIRNLRSNSELSETLIEHLNNWTYNCQMRSFFFGIKIHFTFFSIQNDITRVP